MTQRSEIITYGDFSAPAGTVVTAVVITFLDDLGIHRGLTLSPGGQPEAFDLPPGIYRATAQALDADGNAVGPAAVDSFVMEAPPTVLVSIPLTLGGS
jgi:hypothetical protein